MSMKSLMIKPPTFRKRSWRALSSHLHQAKRRNRQHMRFGFVTLQPLFHQIVNELLVLAAFHVDEIADDQTADVPQTELARAVESSPSSQAAKSAAHAFWLCHASAALSSN